VKGMFATFVGRELVLAPFGDLTQGERERLEEALDRLPEELLPSDYDTVLLLLTEEGVEAHRYAWREDLAL
jgi:hypothetical protein